MKDILEFVERHPVLTVFLVLIIGGVLTDIAKAIRGIE